MPIGSFFQFFSTAKVAQSNPVSISVTNPNQPHSRGQNQQKNVKDEQPLRITLKNPTCLLPPPPQSSPSDLHPHPHSQSREDAEDDGQVQPRVRLRSIFSSISSASPSSVPPLHRDPIRIAFQPTDHDQAIKADSTTTPAAATSAPFQPSAELTISSLSRALSTTLSKSFNRNQIPNKKGLVSKNPTGTSEDGNDHHHYNASAAPPAKKQKMKKKKKSTSHLLGVVPTTGDHGMKKQLTSTSFLNVIGKKHLTKTPSSHISHQANSLTKSRSYSIVQLDRANFLSVPKILTSASIGQQLGLETISVQSAAPPLQLPPDPPTNSYAHYHQDNSSLVTLLVSPPPLPLPNPPKPSFYFNHHHQSDGHEHVSFKESNPSDSQALDPLKLSRKTSSRYALADFDLIRTLGTGSFGRVHLSKSRHNGRGYAIKVLNKKRVVGLKQVEHTNSERQMLAAVRHPFLVNLWGTFSDSYNLYMVMDFVSGGELFNLLRKSQRFPDPVAKFFGAEVALALDYLHCLDIVYRDLKPENILLGSDGHIKITDFGFAKLVPDITWTLCGTPDYLAPEIVQSKGYNKSVDWYALGVLIFEMLAGYPPFYCEEESPMRLYEKIIAGKVRYPSYFNPSAKDLLKSLLTADLSKRFGNLANGSRDIFHHAWFAEVDWERLYRKQIPAPYVPRVSSEWDSSNFDHYDEASLEEYGKVGEDPYGHLFPGF